MTKIITNYIKGIEKLCNFHNVEFTNADVDITKLGYLVGIRIKKDNRFIGFLHYIEYENIDLEGMLYNFETNLINELKEK